jgi:hypothetical protein
MDVLDLQHLFDNDKHVEDDQDCSFPDYEPGMTASEFDRVLGKDDENKEGGDEASKSEPASGKRGLVLKKPREA